MYATTTEQAFLSNDTNQPRKEIKIGKLNGAGITVSLGEQKKCGVDVIYEKNGVKTKVFLRLGADEDGIKKVVAFLENSSTTIQQTVTISEKARAFFSFFSKASDKENIENIKERMKQEKLEKLAYASIAVITAAGAQLNVVHGACLRLTENFNKLNTAFKNQNKINSFDEIKTSGTPSKTFKELVTSGDLADARAAHELVVSLYNADRAIISKELAEELIKIANIAVGKIAISKSTNKIANTWDKCFSKNPEGVRGIDFENIALANFDLNSRNLNQSQKGSATIEQTTVKPITKSELKKAIKREKAEMAQGLTEAKLEKLAAALSTTITASSTTAAAAAAAAAAKITKLRAEIEKLTQKLKKKKTLVEKYNKEVHLFQELFGKPPQITPNPTLTITVQ